MTSDVPPAPHCASMFPPLRLALAAPLKGNSSSEGKAENETDEDLQAMGGHGA